MIVSRSWPAFAITFAVVYSIVYVVAVENNYALFTYHPAIGEFGPLVEKPKEGPAMYWYGWMATAGIAAFVVAFGATFVPERVAQRLWSGWSWAVPVAAMLVMSYILRGFFMR